MPSIVVIVVIAALFVLGAELPANHSIKLYR